MTFPGLRSRTNHRTSLTVCPVTLLRILFVSVPRSSIFHWHCCNRKWELYPSKPSKTRLLLTLGRREIFTREIYTTFNWPRAPYLVNPPISIIRPDVTESGPLLVFSPVLDVSWICLHVLFPFPFPVSVFNPSSHFYISFGTLSYSSECLVFNCLSSRLLTLDPVRLQFSTSLLLFVGLPWLLLTDHSSVTSVTSTFRSHLNNTSLRKLMSYILPNPSPYSTVSFWSHPSTFLLKCFRTLDPENFLKTDSPTGRESQVFTGILVVSVRKVYNPM